MPSTPPPHFDMAACAAAAGAAPKIARWPTGSYGGDDAGRNFIECGKELAAMGRLGTPVRQQLFGQALTNPVTLAQSPASVILLHPPLDSAGVPI